MPTSDPWYLWERIWGLTTRKEHHLLMAAWEWDRFLGNSLVKVMISSYQRPNPKSCPVDAKGCRDIIPIQFWLPTKAKSKGYNEAVTFGCRMGLSRKDQEQISFMRRTDVLYTPPDRGIFLPGITRATVMELGKGNGNKGP